MLIYCAAMVHATPTYNIYNVYNFGEYVPNTVILFMLSENSSIKCDGVVRDTDGSVKATTLSNQGWECGPS